MDKTCKQRRLDIGKCNGSVSGYEEHTTADKSTYTSASRRGARCRNDKITALSLTSSFNVRNRDRDGSKKSDEKDVLEDKTALRKSKRCSDGAIQSLSKHMIRADFSIGEGPKMIQRLEADAEKHFEFKGYRRQKPKMDFVTFHKTIDTSLKRVDTSGRHGKDDDLDATMKTREAYKLIDRPYFGSKRGLTSLRNESTGSITHVAQSTKKTRLPTPMPCSANHHTMDRLAEVLRKKDELLAAPKTYTVNPVVVEMQNKTYKRTEHKIVLKDINKYEPANDLSWFKRLLPEEYFIKPNLKKSILPYKDSPYERTNRQIGPIVESVALKPKLADEKAKEKKSLIKVAEDRLGIGGVNIDDLKSNRNFSCTDESGRKELEQPRPATPKHIELKPMKLPRLPFERIKKQGKGHLSMIESSDDSIRTKEVSSRPTSSKKHPYDRNHFVSRKTLLEDLRKERMRRDEECRRNFNKFMSISHTSKTQEELLKSQDPNSLGRREGLNVLFQRQAEKAANETLLHKWQRLGRKFFPEALTEELRYRKQQYRIFNEYMTNTSSQRQQRQSQSNVSKKSEITGAVTTIQMRQPNVNFQPRSEIDKFLIAKGIEKTMDKIDKQSEESSIKQEDNKPSETTLKIESLKNILQEYQTEPTTTDSIQDSIASTETVSKKEQIVEKVHKQPQGIVAPGKTEAAHVGKEIYESMAKKKSTRVAKVKEPVRSASVAKSNPKKKLTKRGKGKRGKRITETKLKKITDSTKTTASSTVFEKPSVVEPVEPSTNTLDELSWSLRNFPKTQTTNAYWVQTEHNVPPSLLNYTQKALLKSATGKDTTSVTTTGTSDAYVDEWGQYGRTASETDKLLATLTERKKRYPQEIEMVRPILLPSLFNRNSKPTKVPLEKKYPVESELVPPIKLPQLNKTGTSVLKNKPWGKADHPSESRQKEEFRKKEEARKKEEKTPMEALGLVKRFHRGSKIKPQPTSKKPPPDIIPAVIRDQKIRSKDIPRKAKTQVNTNQTNEQEAPSKTNPKRLTLVERLRQRIDARRKAQKIAMMENEYLSGNDKLEHDRVKSPKEHTVGATVYSPVKDQSKGDNLDNDSQTDTEARHETSYNVLLDQPALSWEFLHKKEKPVKQRISISPRRNKTVTKLNREVSPRRCSRDRSVKTSSPEAEVFELRRCEVSRKSIKPRTAGYSRPKPLSRDRPKTTSFTEVESPRQLSPKTPVQQPKTAKTYYVGLSREPSDTDRDYESDFEDDNSLILSQKTNKSRKSGRSRKSYKEAYISDLERKKQRTQQSYRNKDSTDVSSDVLKPKSKTPWNKRNLQRSGFPYKRRKSSDFEESSEKIVRPRYVSKKKPNTVIPSDRKNDKKGGKHRGHQIAKKSSSDVLKNRPEWVSSKRFEPIAPMESFTFKNTHKSRFKHVQPRYLEPKKPKPTPPETPPTPPKKNPKLRAVQSRYLETPNCLRITQSIKSLLERNAERLKGVFPKHIKTVTPKTNLHTRKKLEPLKPKSPMRPLLRNIDNKTQEAKDKRERKKNPSKEKLTPLDFRRSFEKPPTIDFSQDVVNKREEKRRAFPKRLYDDLYTSRPHRRDDLPNFIKERPSSSKAHISNRLKKFDDLLASTQKTFKQKFEFSDLSDADDKETKQFENSFKNILKECDAINDLLTPVLLAPTSDRVDRAFGMYLSNDKPKTTSQNTDYPNFLTWKTDFMKQQKPFNTFEAIPEVKFSKTNDNSSSFTKGQYSVDSEFVTSFPSLTSTPEKSKEVISNTEDCLTPDCYCKGFNASSSASMTYAVCPTSTMGDHDMLSPISSLPELTKKKSESSFSTPTCYCSSVYQSSLSNIAIAQKENSLNELKKKIEEAIVQITLEKPKLKQSRQELPPLKKPPSHVKFFDSVVTKTNSSVQTETPPPLMPGKRQPLSPLSRTTNSDVQSSQTKKRNLFTYPVQIPDPILEQIYKSQNTMNDQIRLPKKFTPLPNILQRHPCNFCPEINKNLNEFLSSSSSSTSLSSISSLPLPWGGTLKLSSSPKESKTASNPSKNKHEITQKFRCSPPSPPFVRNLVTTVKPFSSFTSSSQRSFSSEFKFTNNPLIEYSFPPAEPILPMMKSPLPSILKTSNTKSTRKLSDVKTRLNSPGKKAPKLKNPRGTIQLQTEHSSTILSAVDTLNTLRSISLSGLDNEKITGLARKYTSEISVRKTNVSSKKTSSGRMEDRFPKEVEPVKPVALPSVRAKKFSQSKLYISGQQQTTDGESTTCLSTSLPTLSCVVQHVQDSGPTFPEGLPKDDDFKTETSEKCCLSRTPMTSSIDVTGIPKDMPKPSINRIEQLFQRPSLDAGRNESSLIHVHKTTAVMNVHHIDNDPSAESFLDSSTAGSASICDYLQGEQLRTNLREGVGHRFFRKPPPIQTELIEIKSECPPVVCERSKSDILPHPAPAKMNILQNGVRLASIRQASESPARKENLEAGDSVTTEESMTQTTETESLTVTSSSQTEKLSETSSTSTTTTSGMRSASIAQSDAETEESSEKPAAPPETIVQSVVVEVKGDKTDVSCSQVDPSEKSALKTEQVDAVVSVQSLGSIPPLSPSDVMVGGSPRKNRSLSDVRRGPSPQNRRSAPQEGVGYSFFRGEFDPPIRKPKIDSCVQTEKYRRPKKLCAMTSVDAVD